MFEKYARIPQSLTPVRIRQLQLFVLLAKVGSISEAARQLHMTQPTATEMLRKLEESFGVELFLRGPKGITLTAQGERIARRVALSLRELQWAIEESQLNTPCREILKVGFIPNAMFAGLPEATALFTERHPEIQLKLKELNVPECAAAILQGEIDVAFTLNHPLLGARSTNDEIILMALHEDRFGAYRSTALGLPSASTLSADELSNLPWILPTFESSIRQVFNAWFVQNGATPPEATLEITPMTLGLELLRFMPCLALLPKRLSTMPGYIHLVPVEPMTFEISARFVYAFRSSQAERSAVTRFLDCLNVNG